MKILSLSGFVPEYICDTVRFSQYSGDRNISHYCGYASDFISQVLMDDTIDGAVYPKSCDSTRIITSYLQNSEKFLYQLVIPSYGMDGSEEFFANSIREYKEAIERHYGIEINDIKERIEKINSRNNTIKEIYKRLPEIAYSDYLRFIHEMLKKPLMEQEWNERLLHKKDSEKNIFIVGSFLSNLHIVDSIEQAEMSVVGDTLPESGRIASRPDVDSSGDMIKGIAKSIISTRLSPSQNCFGDIIARDIEEIRRKDVKGVIFVMQKYCEPYEYLYAAYKPKLDELGISSVKLSVNDTEDDRKVALTLEAFSDTL